MGIVKLLLAAHHILVLISLPTCQLQVLTDNCEMLQESDLGNTSIPSTEGLLAAQQGFLLQILETHTVCLGQATLMNHYRSVSVVVRYRRENGSEEVVQVEYQCVNNEWVGDMLPTSPPRANFSTPLRTNCSKCTPEPLFDGAPIEDQHCQSRCKCANVF